MKLRDNDGPIGPDFNRSGPDGDLWDISTGARIGDIEEYGGWTRGPDGSAMRDIDFISMRQTFSSPTDRVGDTSHGSRMRTRIARMLLLGKEH